MATWAVVLPSTIFSIYTKYVGPTSFFSLFFDVETGPTQNYASPVVPQGLLQ